MRTPRWTAREDLASCRGACHRLDRNGTVTLEGQTVWWTLSILGLIAYVWVSTVRRLRNSLRVARVLLANKEDTDKEPEQLRELLDQLKL